MMKILFKMCFLLNVSLLFGVNAYAGPNPAINYLLSTDYSEPEVKHVPSTLTHGQLAEISGIGFGSKQFAQPQIWEDFENGWDNEKIKNPWTSYLSTDSPRYTVSEKYTGNFSMLNSVSKELGTSFNTAWQEFERSDEVYMSYFFKYNVSVGSNYGIMKLARVTSDYVDENGSISHYNGPGDYNFQFQPASGWRYAAYNMGHESIQKSLYADFYPDTWKRIEMYKKLSTPGVSDGEMFIKINNKIVWSEKKIVTRKEGYSFKHNSFLLPLMFANQQEGAVINMYVDDVYVDTTQARVEVANCPDLTLCSKSEIQIPQSWASSKISFKVNLGTFYPGELLYLFVINDKGIISPGVPIVY